MQSVYTIFRRINLPIALGFLITAIGLQNAQASCGASFCTVNTNWNMQGVAVEPGWRFDLRGEYVDQDSPRAGDDKVALGQIRRHHDEVETKNRNVMATLDYAYDDRWGVSVTAPVVEREHLHIHNHRGAKIPERWDFTSLGDVRLLGRYQWRTENAENASLGYYGLNFGVKLPTGSIRERNQDGDLAERSLQPGTGSTDLMLGAYHSRLLANSNSALFVQGLLQHRLATREDYKPGNRLSLDAGYRYDATPRLGLMLQFNALFVAKDKGLEAEPNDSGGSFLFVSPGVSYAIAQNVQLYGFFQQPLRQHVNGVQLTQDWSVASGVSVRF